MTTKTIEFRNRPYQVAYLDVPGHASHWTYEDEKDVRDATWNIEPGDVIVDVGAAYGSYTMAALSAGAAFSYAWVPQVSFELELFKQTLALNGWTEKVQLNSAAGIYDKAGFLDVDAQTFGDVNTGQPSCIAVEKLDDWYACTAPLVAGRKWLKVDVEGAEVAVIAGATNFITNERPIIQIENHLFKDSQIDKKVRVAIEPLGYTMTWNQQYHAVSHSVFKPTSK